jgi:hypothetical protein
MKTHRNLKLLLLTILSMVSVLAFSQQANDSIAVNGSKQSMNDLIYKSHPSALYAITVIEDAKKMAQSHIKNGIPYLLIQGGIVPVISEQDITFGKKYGVQFYDFGCLAIDTALMTAYNEVVIEYLNDKYGSKLFKELRPDIKGLKSQFEN